MKKFLLKDQSGRGYHATLTHDEVLENCKDTIESEGEDFTEWLESSEVGDSYTTDDYIKFTCIGLNGL